MIRWSRDVLATAIGVLGGVLLWTAYRIGSESRKA